MPRYFFEGLLVLVTLATVTQARCPVGAVQGTSPDDCYTFVSDASVWYDAEEACVERGGHLASISSAFVNGFLRQQANEQKWSGDYWTGGSSFGTGWSWSDGTPFKYQQWAKGQPGVADGPLCIAPKTLTGQWYASSCYASKPFVCKLPAIASEHCPKSTPCAISASTTRPVHRTTTTLRLQPSCDAGWGYSNVTHKCYKVVDPQQHDVWGQQLCATQGGSVLSIHSATENQAVLDMVEIITGDRDYAAIGLHRPKGKWEWADGSPLDYTNWSPKGEFLHCSRNGGDCLAVFQIANPEDGVPGQWLGYDFTPWSPGTICVKAPH